MPHDVFVSHASQDTAVADAVVDALEVRGVQCWVAPRDVRPGQNYMGAITQAIETAPVMVLILSEESNASGHVMRELEQAVSKGVAILPLRISDVTVGQSVQYALAGSHWLDATSGPLEDHLQTLVAAVVAMLASRPDRMYSNAPTASAAPSPTNPTTAAHRAPTPAPESQSAFRSQGATAGNSFGGALAPEPNQPGSSPAYPHPAAAHPQGSPFPVATPVDQYGNAISPLSRTIALVLAVLLGYLGIHRFYSGKVGTGILMLLTFGGFGIWWLIDVVMIGVGQYRDKQGLWLRNWQLK